jgi:hypothetical protein
MQYMTQERTVCVGVSNSLYRARRNLAKRKRRFDASRSLPVSPVFWHPYHVACASMRGWVKLFHIVHLAFCLLNFDRFVLTGFRFIFEVARCG